MVYTCQTSKPKPSRNFPLVPVDTAIPLGERTAKKEILPQSQFGHASALGV
jgi:hypothetical protein